MGVEFMNALSIRLSEALPPTLLFDYATLDALATHVAHSVLGLGSAETAATIRDRSDLTCAVLASVEELSEEDALRALTKRLAEPPGT
jgi:polyketide synthase PksL